MTQYRYIITRPCLLEGTLTIAKYLRPLFPSELYGQALNMRDEQGRDYAVRLSAGGSRLTGMGALYHAMNLNVNDVLMIERVGSNEYRVQGVSKPYSRPQPTETYGAKPPETSARRIVIEASPHVREIRLEREAPAPAEPLDGKVEVRRSEDGGGAVPARLEPRSEALPAARIEVRHEPRGDRGEAEGAKERVVASKDWLAERQSMERLADERAREPRAVGRPQGAELPRVEVSRREISRVERTDATGSSERAQAEQPLRAELLNRDPDRQAARRVQGVQTGSAQAGQAGQQATQPVRATAPTAPSSVAAARLPSILTGQRSAAPQSVDTVQIAAVTQTPASVQGVAAAQPPQTQVASPATQPGGPVPVARGSAESLKTQLAQLAELVGYRLEYLGGPGHESGPVRLRAELGAQSYDVMLALTESDMQFPAFRQGTYHALMTWEVDTASGAPRFTREALTALLENARLAPLTPLELRPYWNTASFDLSSVASVAELVSAYLAQRGTFTYVLSTLAQQPAHSVVDPQRLAEKLGSGVNGAELRVVLDTLSRPPFTALLPLQGGQYYLRAEVSTILNDLSQYASGVARRLQPPTRAGAAVTVQG